MKVRASAVGCGAYRDTGSLANDAVHFVHCILRLLNNDGEIKVDDKGKTKVAYGMKNESPL